VRKYKNIPDMVVLQGIFKDGIQHVKLMSFNITMGNDRIQNNDLQRTIFKRVIGLSKITLIKSTSILQIVIPDRIEEWNRNPIKKNVSQTLHTFHGWQIGHVSQGKEKIGLGRINDIDIILNRAGNQRVPSL
jgi:hypothetical protein